MALILFVVFVIVVIAVAFDTARGMTDFGDDN